MLIHAGKFNSFLCMEFLHILALLKLLVRLYIVYTLKYRDIYVYLLEKYLKIVHRECMRWMIHFVYVLMSSVQVCIWPQVNNCFLIKNSYFASSSWMRLALIVCCFQCFFGSLLPINNSLFMQKLQSRYNFSSIKFGSWLWKSSANLYMKH